MKLYLLISLFFVFVFGVFTFYWLGNNRIIPGTGAIVTKPYEINNFSKIKMESPANLVIKKGAKLSASVSDYESLQQDTSLINQDSTLVISSKAKNFINYTSSAIITIITPGAINDVEVIGSSDVIMDDPFMELQQVSVNGSGDFKSLKIGYYNQLITNLKGSGEIQFNGYVSLLDAIVEGSGGLSLKNLEAQKIKAVLTGSGEMNLNTKESLDATITGSGNINYTGSGIVTPKITGSGQISNLN